MNDRRVIEDELAALGEAPLDDSETADAELAMDVVDVTALFDAAHGGGDAALDDLARARVWRSVSGRVAGSSQRAAGRSMSLWLGSALAVAAAVLLVVTVLRPADSPRVPSSGGGDLRAEAAELKAVASAALAALDRGDGHESERAGELARLYAARLGKGAG